MTDISSNNSQELKDNPSNLGNLNPPMSTQIVPTNQSPYQETATNLVINKPRLTSGLKSAEALATLRANINIVADRLESLLETEEVAATIARLLNKITFRLRESNNQKEIFNTAVSEAREALQADRVVVYSFDSNWKGTIVAESVGRGWRAALGETIADPCFAERYVQMYQNGRISATENIYQAGLTKCHLAQLEPYDVKANLVVPIVANQKLYGLLIAHQCSAPRRWHESEIDFFSQLATQIGYALVQVILLEATETSAKQAKLLNQISSRIRENLNPYDIFSVAVSDTREVLQADRVVVYAFDSSWRGKVVAESVTRGWKAAINQEIADPCFAERYVQPYQRGRTSATENIYEAGLTECHLAQLEPYGVKANLVVPVLAKRKLYGLLIAHQCSAPRRWKDSEIDFMKQVGVQVGFALDQAVLIEDQRNAVKQAQLLNRITSRLQESFDQDTIFDSVVEQTKISLEADRVIVYRFDENWQGTVVAESVDRPWKSALGETIADPCFASRYVKQYQMGRVNATPDIQKAGLTECHLKQLEPYQVKANLVVPILANQKLYGLLIVHQCSKPREWYTSEIDFLKQIATQVGFAIQQVQLIEKQQAIADQAQRLNRIVSNIRQSLIAEDIFAAAVENTQEALKADRVIVYRFDENWQGTVVAESVVGEYPPSLGAKIFDPCFADRYVKQYQKGRIKATANIQQAGLTECHLAQLEPFKVKANLVVPILAKQKLYGLLIAHQCSDPRQWLESEIDFVSQVSTQIGFALDQAILLEEQQAATQQAQMLNEIVGHIREHLDPQRILQTTVAEIRKAMKVERAVIYRFDENFDGNIVAESVTSDYLSIIDIPNEVSCFPVEYVKQYQQGRICTINDLTQARLTDCHREKLEQWQVKANIVVPIMVKDKLYGLLGIHQCSSARIWQQSEIDFIKQLAIQVAYAFDQALLLQEMETSRQKAENISQSQREEKEVLQTQIRTFMKDIEGSFSGDLTVRAMVSEGEMGTVADFFNVTIENLQELVMQVQSSAVSVAETVQNSESLVNQADANAHTQLESIKQALAKLQFMAKSIHSVAVNAKQAQQKVEQGNQTILTGDKAMNEMVITIKTIQQTVEKTAKKVKRLGVASQNISRIVNLISDIARQTNLLALNASIEAKNTGNEGQDFTLIATEVRNLAEQSAEAAKEIEEIVAQIQTETSEVVNSMEAGQKQVNMGVNSVEAARTKLSEITAVSTQIRAIVGQMATAALAEVKNTSELSKTMQEVAGIAAQTSNQSKELTASFKNLLNVASELEESVTQFKIN